MQGGSGGGKHGSGGVLLAPRLAEGEKRRRHVCVCMGPPPHFFTADESKRIVQRQTKALYATARPRAPIPPLPTS